jgi:hypothetical protein
VVISCSSTGAETSLLLETGCFNSVANVFAKPGFISLPDNTSVAILPALLARLLKSISAEKL